MRAVQVTTLDGPKAVELRDVPEPEAVGPFGPQVLVDVHAVGISFPDLLLSRGEPEGGAGLVGLAAAPEEAQRFRQACREVRERAGQTLEWVTQQRWLLDIALDHLSLGRSHLGLALTAGGPATPGGEAEADFAQTAEHLDRAVEGLQKAGQEDYLTRGLLARAAFHRLRGNLAGAAADLAEALEIAERGGMRLFLCDAHLEGARLARKQGDEAEARRHVALARQLVNETGYGRREREVRWLEGELAKASEATTVTAPAQRFRLALSFPGEHRSSVEQVAEHLSVAVGREPMLYDKFYEAEFARVDLDVYLPRLYREQSELIVLFLCPEYRTKRWCQLELRHIRQLIATVDAGRIMLLSFGRPGDLSELGILPGDGYVDVADRPAAEIAGLILQHHHDSGLCGPKGREISAQGIGR